MTSMELLESAARGLLIAVFVLSGSVKLVRPFGAALALAQFRMVRRVRLELGRAAGVTELVVGLGLFFGPAELWLPAAAVMLLGFSVMIGAALSRGERFDCACFGGHGAPLGALTLARTLSLFLVAGAGVVAAVSGSSSPSWDELFAGVSMGALFLSSVFVIVELTRGRPFSWSLDVRGGEWT